MPLGAAALGAAFIRGAFRGRPVRTLLPFAATGAGLILLGRRRGRHARFEHAVTIRRSPQEVFAFLENLDNWPKFSTRIVTVERATPLRWCERLGPRSSRWWTLTQFDARPPEVLTWHAEAPGLAETGSLSLTSAPGERGTEVREIIEVRPARPAFRGNRGPVGRTPDRLFRRDLRQLKRLIELGELPTVGRAPAGRRGPISRALLKTEVVP